MTLAAPRYTTTSLQPWLDATALSLPLPPCDRSEWTCLARQLGPARLLLGSDRDEAWCDAVLLRSWLEALGRPTAAHEQEALLLVTPIAAGEAPAALSRLLQHGSYWVRHHALLAHAALGIAAPGVRAALADSDNDVRRAAAEATGRLGDRAAIPLLLRREWDGDSSVSAARVEALVRLDAWPEVVAQLGDVPEGEPRQLLESLGGGSGSAVLEWLGAGADTALRRPVARWLMARPEIVAEHAEAMVASVVAEPGFDEHRPMARALGAAGEDAVDAVIEVLDHEDWQLRAWACTALAWAGEAAAGAESALVARLDDDDGDVQREAALALASSGCRPGDMSRRLARTLTREHGFLSRARQLAPGALGPAACLLTESEVPPGLFGVLGRNGEERLRGVAALVLALERPDAAAPVLEAMARDDARDVPLPVRRFCAAAGLLTARPPAVLGVGHRLLLAHTGDANGSAPGPVEGLAQAADQLATLAVKDGDWPMRIDAMRLLQRLGTAAHPYLELLRWQSKHDPDGDVRRVGSEFFSGEWNAVGPAASLVALLQPHKGSTDDASRGRALHRLSVEDPDLAVPLARELLTSETRPVARAAARVLGSSLRGEAVRDEVAQAVVRLEDSGWVVREAACDLLGAVSLAHLEAGLHDEVVEGLKVRSTDDYDDDVRAAAAAALVALGATP